MVQTFAKNSRLAPPRRAAALLLAFVLNVAFVPCAMAIEAIADEHDCCPPELRLDPSDCCEVNDGSVQTRGATFEFDAGEKLAPGPAYAALVSAVTGHFEPAADPPDPPDCRPDLNALYCVYLK